MIIRGLLSMDYYQYYFSYSQAPLACEQEKKRICI